MAKKHPITRPIHAQGGPVTRAIAAVRQPVAPWFAPIKTGDPMQSGWHVGRRHDWDDQGREELVFLDLFEEESGWRFALWRCGGGQPENPNLWSFSLRVGGIRSMPSDPIDLTATRH